MVGAGMNPNPGSGRKPALQLIGAPKNEPMAPRLAPCACLAGRRSRTGASCLRARRSNIPLTEYSLKGIVHLCIGKLNTPTSSPHGGMVFPNRNKSRWMRRFACLRNAARIWGFRTAAGSTDQGMATCASRAPSMTAGHCEPFTANLAARIAPAGRSLQPAGNFHGSSLGIW